jgi:HD superfamily phosphohydrolase
MRFGLHAVIAKDYREAVRALAERILQPYLARLRPADRRPKVINDPVWQTVILYPFEVIILDSPLMQRLRGIRQLGVAHWTYPSAHHSRLEHSIGAVHNVDRLLEAFSRSLERADQLRPKWANLLRLAALCHDIGHGFMSHVSENAVDALGCAIDLKMELAEELGVEECTLAEAASYYILESPAFQELAASAQKLTNHQLPEGFQTHLPRLILGLPVHDRFPLIQEIISGPFDADKLDYMTRDAQMSGIPIVTDIPRLIHKARLVEVATDKLTPQIARRVKDVHPTYFVQGIATSGARTLDELMIGRTLLYDKIYRHQKVRATEAMVLGIMAAVAENEYTTLPILPLLLRDHEILHLTAEGLKQKTGLVPNAQRLEAAQDLSKRLRDRRLFVAAYAFSHYLPSDPFKDTVDQKVGLERLRSQVDQAEARYSLVERITKTLRQIRQLVPDVAPQIADEALHFYFALDPPSPSSGTSKIAKALLITTSGDIVAFRDDCAEAAPWSNAYLLTRDLGFVFCAEEIAPAVHLATELVLRRDLKIRTPESVFEYAKVDRSLVGDLRRQLETRGFYPRDLADLRPEPQRLAMADVRPRISRICNNLAPFEGLAGDPGKLMRTGVSPLLVRTWLRQFDDRWVEAAMDVLAAVRVLGSSEVRPALSAFIAGNPDLKGCTVCPLGSPRDSSSVVSYYIGDHQGEYGLHSADLPTALGRRDGRPILFVDDFIGQGAQSTTILAQWMGETGQLGEQHVDPLPADLQTEFRARQVYFLFVGGDSRGADRLLKVAGEKLGLRPVSFAISHRSSDLPSLFDAKYFPEKSPAMDPAFREICQETGEELLAEHNGKVRTREWIRERALGFGNTGLLIAFPYNTPTQTLTLLWSRGRARGADWLPILPRRSKS